MKNNILIRLSLTWFLTVNCVFSAEKKFEELTKEEILFFKKEYPSDEKHFPNDKIIYCFVDLNNDGVKEVLLSKKGEHGYGRHNIFFVYTKKQGGWSAILVEGVKGLKNQATISFGLDDLYLVKDSKTKKTYYVSLGTPLEKGNETYLVIVNAKGFLVKKTILLESFIMSIKNPIFEKIEIQEEPMQNKMLR